MTMTKDDIDEVMVSLDLLHNSVDLAITAGVKPNNYMIALTIVVSVMMEAEEHIKGMSREDVKSNLSHGTVLALADSKIKDMVYGSLFYR